MQKTPSFPSTQYHLFALLMSCAAAVFLLGSFAWPTTGEYWFLLDAQAFQALNHTLSHLPAWDIFWSLTNNRAFDLVPALFLILLFTRYALADGRKHFAERIGEGLWIAIYVIFFFQLFHTIWDFHRISASGVIPDAILLSELHPELLPKDYSRASFPADHTFVTLMGSLMLWRVYYRDRLPQLLLIPIFFSLPRLVGGAHWLTDTLVGAVSMCFVAFGIALYTPVIPAGAQTFRRLLQRWGLDRRLAAIPELPFLSVIFKWLTPK